MRLIDYNVGPGGRVALGAGGGVALGARFFTYRLRHVEASYSLFQ